MKKISQIETGGRFLYGGVEWVKLYAGDGTVAISAEPVFERAFDEPCRTRRAEYPAVRFRHYRKYAPGKRTPRTPPSTASCPPPPATGRAAELRPNLGQIKGGAPCGISRRNRKSPK